MTEHQVDLKQDSKDVLSIHTDMMKLHYEAMACHSEVMGMMSENMVSACVGQQPLFSTLHFREVMFRWGMIDEKGQPII